MNRLMLAAAAGLALITSCRDEETLARMKTLRAEVRKDRREWQRWSRSASVTVPGEIAAAGAEEKMADELAAAGKDDEALKALEAARAQYRKGLEGARETQARFDDMMKSKDGASREARLWEDLSRNAGLDPSPASIAGKEALDRATKKSAEGDWTGARGAFEEAMTRYREAGAEAQTRLQEAATRIESETRSVWDRLTALRRDLGRRVQESETGVRAFEREAERAEAAKPKQELEAKAAVARQEWEILRRFQRLCEDGIFTGEDFSRIESKLKRAEGAIAAKKFPAALAALKGAKDTVDTLLLRHTIDDGCKWEAAKQMAGSAEDELSEALIATGFGESPEVVKVRALKATGNEGFTTGRYPPAIRAFEEAETLCRSVAAAIRACEKTLATAVQAEAGWKTRWVAVGAGVPAEATEATASLRSAEERIGKGEYEAARPLLAGAEAGFRGALAALNETEGARMEAAAAEARCAEMIQLEQAEPPEVAPARAAMARAAERSIGGDFKAATAAFREASALFGRSGGGTLSRLEKFTQLHSLSHTSVNGVAIAPDGKILASAGYQGVKLWDIAGGQELRTLSLGDGSAEAVAFSPDGRRMAAVATINVSGNYVRRTRVWDTGSWSEVRTFEPTGENCVLFTPDGTCVIAGDGKLREIATGRVLRELEEGNAYDYSFDRDGTWIASAWVDGFVRLWDAKKGDKARKLAGHTAKVGAIAFSPDGRLLASGSDDLTVRLWTMTDQTHLRTLSGHTKWVSAVTFTPDGKALASGSWDQEVKFWHTASGKLLRTIGTKNTVYAIQFSPNGNVMGVGTSSDVQIWGVKE